MLLSFSHITFLFDGDTGVYMKVSAGWCVPPTSLVVASDDIVVLAGFPGGPVPRTQSRTSKLAMMAWRSKSQILLIHHLTTWDVEEQKVGR